MKSVTSAEMRELDRRTIEEFGTPGDVLMERAGRGLADSILLRKGWLAERCRGVTAVAGRGNNGGDACVAARLLKEAGVPVRLLAACEPADYKGDAALHFKRMAESGVPFQALPDVEDWSDKELACRGQIIVDGVLGTGTKGAARGTPESAIKWINRMKQANTIVAIDIPSGLNADSGEAEGEAVRADWTVTMGAPKTGLINPCSLEFVGNLEVVDIGIPSQYTRNIGVDPELIVQNALAGIVPARGAASHKGSHGTVLVLAGSAAFPGAAVLCAMGAVRSGAGLVNVITTANAASSVTASAPEAIVRAVETDGESAMSPEAALSAVRAIPKYDSVVIGPGMTNSESTRIIVEQVLSLSSCPVLIDADALNVIAASEISAARERADVVITPHPGEAARLAGITAKEVQADRLGVLRKLSKTFKGVVVLKGAGTLIAADGVEAINLTGNAGMAKGGSGDVLAGLTGGLLAQGLAPADAARLGVFVHGRAGDIAASRGSVQGMTAGDTATCITEAFSTLA